MSGSQARTRSVLVVDDDTVVRETITRQLRESGYDARPAGSYAEALSHLERSARGGIVILDHPTAGCNVTDFIASVERVSPGTLVIGSSGSDRRDEFAVAGVTRYLQKPWRISDLEELLARKIESCVDCGMALPLRRPESGETGESWTCAFCGSRYHAILDESSSDEIRSNARRVER